MEPDRWQRVTAIFEQALEREGEARLAFVKGSCDGDAELQREVEVLLSSHDEAGSFLSASPASPSAAASSKTPALTPGTRLGSYEVTAKIGEGGMGEVYRARDTKLDRDVALKVLPSAFTADPERLARFEREAKVMASLSHSSIGSIYGVEDAGEVRALVLELVEGPTLADRIAEGSLPIDEALPIAKQIAEALETAHDQGIVHRDLKPANIKLRPDGTVKVLDFGLAKGAVESGRDPSHSPTITAAATAAGVLLGTAAYMSPEQARGKPAGKQSDVWAFGCVFYEMLTGRRLFAGESVSDTLAAVLTSEADVDALPQAVPASGQRLLRRCLERDPRRRLKAVGDGVLQIEEDLTSQAEPHGGKETGQHAISARWVTSVVLVAAVCIAAAVATVWNRPPEQRSRDALSVMLPAGVTLAADTQGRVVAAVSPDGQDLVFVGVGGATSQLYHRPLGQPDAVPLADTQGAMNPFFSPDGRWVGFKVGDLLKRIPLAGGATETVCTLPFNPNEDRWTDRFGWGDDDTIWFGHHTSGLYRVAAGGGVPQQATNPAEAQGLVLGHYAPFPLPDGVGVLYTASGRRSHPDRVSLYVPETGETRILADGIRPWFASSGHIVFADVSGGALWALAFDLDRLEVLGEAVPVRERIRVSAYATLAYLGSDGTLVYVPDRGEAGLLTLAWVDREGNETTLNVTPRSYHSPRLSPDGASVVVSAIENMGRDIWAIDLDRGVETRLTNSPGADWYPIWTPDGESIVFDSQGDLVTQAIDGSGGRELLASHPERSLYPGSWSADGRTLVLTDWDIDGPTGLNVSVLTRDRDTQPRALVETEYAELRGEVSPDGRWLAFESNASGQFEIYVTPFPDVEGARIQVSTDGGLSPAWSATGRELFYRGQVYCPGAVLNSGPTNDTEGTSLEGCEKSMMAVSFETDPAFTPGTPEVLFQDPYYSATGRHYDVAADGRFLVIKRAGQPRELMVVRNWTDEIEERAPAQ